MSRRIKGLVTRPKQHHFNSVGELFALMPTPAWSGEQPCLDVDTYTVDRELSKDETEELRDICAGCAVLESCRDWAIVHEQYYFHGGMTAAERQAWRRKHRIQLVDRYHLISNTLGLPMSRKYAETA